MSSLKRCVNFLTTLLHPLGSPLLPRPSALSFCAFFLVFSCLPLLASAVEKPKAADLVKDGQAIDLTSERYAKLFDELQVQHNFNRDELERWFTGVSINKKVLELMDRQWEAKPYYKYRPLFVTRKTISKGKKMLSKHRQLLDRIEARFGVEREVIIAIWGIESRFGTNRGSFKVFETLNTLFDAYPRRSSFFREELIYFLIVCRENHMDPLKIKGSYAGAFGQTQFISSSFHEYAVSFDDDTIRDVFNSTEDVLASIANYLRHFHWTLKTPIYVDIGSELKTQELISANLKGRKGKVDYRTVSEAQMMDLPAPPENRELTIVGLEKDPAQGGGYRYVAGYPNFQAITEWNHSNRYAMAVTELAEAIRIP
ncbi:MAG: lytic murein transglycosylase [Desulfocapsaceae bacterium]